MRILVTAIESAAGEAVINNLLVYNHYLVGSEIYNKEWIANSLLVDAFYKIPSFHQEKE